MTQDSGQVSQPTSTVYPQYVAPDPSHVVTATRTPSAFDGNALLDPRSPPMTNVTVQDFPAFHVDRNGNTTVLVRSSAEATKASSVKGS